jgi:hypothetical protein
MKDNDMRSILIGQGVRKLKLFGFRNVTKENIMNDEVYRLYFERILNSNLGVRAADDETITELIAEIKKDTDPN